MIDNQHMLLTSMFLPDTLHLTTWSFWKKRFESGELSEFFLTPTFLKGDIFGGWPNEYLVQSDQNKDAVDHTPTQRKGVIKSSYISWAYFSDWSEIHTLAEMFPTQTFCITIGLSTYPFNDKNVNLHDIKQQILSLPDNIHLCFVNGWDLYSDEHLGYSRLESFAKRLEGIDNKRIRFYLCNQRILDKAKKYFPECHTEYYSVYPVRMVDSVGFASHPKYFCNTKKHRSRKLISLNNHVKGHRKEVVETLRPFLETKEVYLSLRGENLFLEKESVIPYDENFTFIEQLQDAPPRRVMTNSYAYVATETHFTTTEVIPTAGAPGMIDVPPDEYYSWFTEKQLKAFYYELPFLHVGFYKNLEEIRRAGFQTFPEFFDESYDLIHDDKERLNAICKTLLDYMAKPIQEIHDLFWSDDVQEKIKHNKDVFLKLVETDPFNKYYGFEDGK